MDEYNALRSQDIMTASIFTFLENLLAAVRTSETLASEALERDQISISTDIKPGGYSEDLFIFLSEREKEEYICCVCYLVIKDVHQCSNGHKFCYSCIYVWSTCNRTGADCCPACRCEGVYARNEQLNEKISSKRVKCQDDGCNWRGFLRDYIEHEHRHYEFKELNRSIDLPHINTGDTTKVTTPPSLLHIAPLDQDKDVPENVPTLNSIENISIPLTSNTISNQEHVVVNSSRVNVSRTNLTPRRLARLPETTPNVLRTVGPRSITHTYPRPVNASNSRCTTLQPRPPRIPRPSRSLDLSSAQSNTGRGAENIVNRLNQNESTQTYNDSNNTTLILSSRDSVRELPRLLNSAGSRDSHSPLFPPISNSTRTSLASERPIMEYRRLAPTYASRRQNMGFMNDGQENFTRMLILLTSDLDERVPSNVTQSRDHLNNSYQRNVNISSNHDTTFPNHSITNPSNSRLQEFRNLNRRLSEVANSLDMLIESTSRQGATLNSNDNSSTSGTASDTEG